MAGLMFPALPPQESTTMRESAVDVSFMKKVKWPGPVRSPNPNRTENPTEHHRQRPDRLRPPGRGAGGDDRHLGRPAALGQAARMVVARSSTDELVEQGRPTSLESLRSGGGPAGGQSH